MWASASCFFHADQILRRVFCFERPYQMWTWSLRISPRLYHWIVDCCCCFSWPHLCCCHALCQRTQSPFWSRHGLSQEHTAEKTLSLGDKEPSTGVWDQAPLALWFRETKLAICGKNEISQQCMTLRQGDRCAACTPDAPLLPGPCSMERNGLPMHGPNYLCGVKAK